MSARALLPRPASASSCRTAAEHHPSCASCPHSPEVSRQMCFITLATRLFLGASSFHCTVSVATHLISCPFPLLPQTQNKNRFWEIAGGHWPHFPVHLQTCSSLLLAIMYLPLHVYLPTLEVSFFLTSVTYIYFLIS